MTVTDIRDPFAVVDNEEEQTAEILTLPERTGSRLTAEQMAERSEEFPYGRRADGTARAKPGRASTGGPRLAASPKPRKPAVVRPAAKKGEADYRPGLMGLLQIPSMALSVLGRQTGNPALQADGYALAMHAPTLVEAINETAKAQPKFAKALDNIMKAGPYGALLAATIPLVMQLAANHKVMPPQPAMGVHTVEELVAASNEQLANMGGSAE